MPYCCSGCGLLCLRKITPDNVAVISSQHWLISWFSPDNALRVLKLHGQLCGRKIFLILSWCVLKAGSILLMKSKQHLILRVTKDNWWVHSSDSWGTKAIMTQHTWLAARIIDYDWDFVTHLKTNGNFYLFFVSISIYYCSHASFFFKHSPDNWSP